MIELIAPLFGVIAIVIIILLLKRYYKYHSTPRLTGKYRVKKNIGFLKDEVIIEYILDHKLHTKIATDEEKKMLKDKFKIDLN